MRRIHWALLRVATVVVVGWSILAWTSHVGVAAGQSAQAQGPSAATRALLKDAIVLDDHVHLETSVVHQGLDPWKVQETGLFDYARAKRGGLNVVVHAVYTEDAYYNYNYGVKQALRLIETFYQILDANQDKMELALTSADVRRIVGKGKMAAILALEGNPDVDGDLKVLQMWYRLGVRMIQLTAHDSTNALIDAARDEAKWGGLSDKGRAFIREMNRLGIIVDPSHASEAATLQVIEASKAPIISTHNGLVSANFSGADMPKMSYGRASGLRISDEAYKALAAKGGMLSMIQSAVISKPVAMWQLANPVPASSGVDESGVFMGPSRRSTLVLPNKGIRPPDKDYGAYITALDAEMDDNWAREPKMAGLNYGPGSGIGYGTAWRTQQQKLIEAGVPLPTVADWIEHAAYAIKLTGEDHVGIGLDMMSRPAMRDFDATQYWQFAEGMLAKGMAPVTVKKILGENFLRILDQAKVPGIEPPPVRVPGKSGQVR